ncbi:hypothetical protein KFE25_012660 [Diacronema lutheri]|uniref:Uncharacterized protein n=1 Tax=Diacronema lutheri TaxID=2081491 RepID=A0A8J6C1Z2_DIALT|nr:hypothetical protein KFE25_012660 [Diacronema lutheri]
MASSTRSSADEIAHALLLAKTVGDDAARRHLELWLECVEHKKDALIAKLEFEKATLMRTKTPLVEKLINEKNTPIAEKSTLVREGATLIAEKSTLVHEGATLTAERDALAAEKELKEMDLAHIVFRLAKYQPVFLPRILIVSALRAKYPVKAGTPFPAKAAWARFFKEHVLDATTNELCATVAAIANELGRADPPNVLQGDLETLLERLPPVMHSHQFAFPGFPPGLYCGGGAKVLGSTNAIAVKVLQDDPDVVSAGVLAHNITCLDKTYEPAHVLMADHSVQRAVHRSGVFKHPVSVYEPSYG